MALVSLTSDDGAVINLEGNATDLQIINSDKSWLVQFYFTWCGYCITFAPKYQNAAESLKGRLSKYCIIS